MYYLKNVIDTPTPVTKLNTAKTVRIFLDLLVEINKGDSNISQSKL